MGPNTLEVSRGRHPNPCHREWHCSRKTREDPSVRGPGPNVLTQLARWLPCTLLQGSVPCSPGNLRIQFVEVQCHRDQLPALLQGCRAELLGRRSYHVVKGPCLPTSTSFTLSPRYIPYRHVLRATCVHWFWVFPEFLSKLVPASFGVHNAWASWAMEGTPASQAIVGIKLPILADVLRFMKKRAREKGHSPQSWHSGCAHKWKLDQRFGDSGLWDCHSHIGPEYKVKERWTMWTRCCKSLHSLVITYVKCLWTLKILSKKVYLL